MRLFQIFLLLIIFQSYDARAQRRAVYTLLQAGGLLGVSTNGTHDPMHGYQFQFIFGRNFDERFQAGLGIGNDIYRGRTTISGTTQSIMRVNTLPIFADLRAPVGSVSPLGRFGVMANAGYAPGLGSDYQRGFMGKAGFTYGHLLAERSELLFSAGYGFQQFDSRYLFNSYSQHNVFITVGLFVH